MSLDANYIYTLTDAHGWPCRIHKQTLAAERFNRTKGEFIPWPIAADEFGQETTWAEDSEIEAAIEAAKALEADAQPAT